MAGYSLSVPILSQPFRVMTVVSSAYDQLVLERKGKLVLVKTETDNPSEGCL